ncbi:Protein tweety [Gossypium arboreum]|uniref:Protein tweety n=1 Tax=Gossypium arboreum TaxID=29729 RepID=A0A0B0N3D1_GOSAR|nr:Protein tweety [Gossypium arboreum]
MCAKYELVPAIDRPKPQTTYVGSEKPIHLAIADLIPSQPITICGNSLASVSSSILRSTARTSWLPK